MAIDNIRKNGLSVPIHDARISDNRIESWDAASIFRLLPGDVAGHAVSYATGRYEDYDPLDFIPGRIYYLTDDLGNPHLILDGKEYNQMHWGSVTPNN